MKSLVLTAVLAVLLAGCTDQKEQAGKAPPARQAAGDAAAGKAYADRECKGCHGLDGKSMAPAIPHLAAQREPYLVAALQAYKEGKRNHAALKDMVQHMTDADLRNVAAYYAGLPAVKALAGRTPAVSPYDTGKELASACASCHGPDGNGTKPGIPVLAGQQPRYFVAAIQEYLAGERPQAPMHATLRGLRVRDMESLALYFGSQQPSRRPAPPIGDPAAGEPLTAVCGGCHGSHGSSADAATPVLAGQDALYLVGAIKSYRSERKREDMRRYVTGLSEKDIQNIAAFYSAQPSRPVEKGQTILQDLTARCNRCHAPETGAPASGVPKIAGQDKDYLIMALRAYRDDKRESSMMHKMTMPYSDSIIEGISSVYAAQPAR